LKNKSCTFCEPQCDFIYFSSKRQDLSLAGLQTKTGVERVRSLMSAPVKKRGKEREVPKPKQPSALRKVRYFGMGSTYNCVSYF